MQLVKLQTWLKLGCLSWAKNAGIKSKCGCGMELLLPAMKPELASRARAVRVCMDSPNGHSYSCWGGGGQRSRSREPGGHHTRNQAQTSLEPAGTEARIGLWKKSLAQEKAIPLALPLPCSRAGPIEAGSSEQKCLENELCPISAQNLCKLR